MIFSTQEPHCTIPDDLKCIYIKCVVLNTRLTKDIKKQKKTHRDVDSNLWQNRICSGGKRII